MDLPDNFIFDGSMTGDPVWIIDKYMDIGFGRTVVGELVYQIKYNGNRMQVDNLRIIVAHSVLQLKDFRREDQSLSGIDAVVAVPSTTGKQNPLPKLIATTVSDVLNIPDLSDKLTRIGTSGPAKSGNVVTASMFRAENSLADRRILVVDDVYRSGSTIKAVTTCLRLAGARATVGLCLAKADYGMK